MLMIHRIVLCEAPKATASCGWATLSPDTEAMTAIRAMQTANRTARRRFGSWRVPECAVVTDMGVLLLGERGVRCDHARRALRTGHRILRMTQGTGELDSL